MTNSEKNIICKNCGEENPAGASVCESCGIELNKNSRGNKKNPNQKNKSTNDVKKASQNQLTSINLIYIVVSLVVIGMVLLIGSGSFTEPAAVVVPQNQIQAQTPSGDNPHGGVDLNSLQKINELQQIVDSNPENSKALVDLAHLLNDSGFYEKAVTRYNEYLAKFPKDSDVLVDMGVCYYEMKNYDQAVSSMKKALEFTPGHQIAHFNLGIVYMASGSMDQAKEWWQKAVKLNPNSNIGKKAQDLLNSN